MASINVPLGYMFVPTVQVLMVYLFNKVYGLPLPSSAIPEVDVYGRHPCFLPAGDEHGEEKFYFVKRKRISKNKNGKRPRRIQEGHAYAYDDGTIDVGGWWKATTGKKDIYSEGGNRKCSIWGFKRTLKFYSFKNKNKERSEATGTDWIMHEYSLNNTEFQEWVICGIKYNGKKSKAVGGTTRGEYLDDSCAALTTTITTPVAETMLASNQDHDITTRADDQEEEELMANRNEPLYKEDHLNPLHHLEVNSNNISIFEDDQNSSKKLALEKEVNGHGFVNHGYHDLQTLQQVQPLEINARINEDSQNLSERVFENKDIQNWNSSVVTGIEQNEKAVRSWEHDDWLKNLHAFVGYEEEEDLVRTQVLKELMEFLYKEDQDLNIDLNLLRHLEVNSVVPAYWLRVYIHSLNMNGTSPTSTTSIIED